MPLVLQGATIVDGSGAPRVEGDVLVVDGRITAVGEVDVQRGVEAVDLRGLVLAPGFIDIHTHYDAQVLWDPDLTPSCWHGVTSVIMGNCGFGLAPTRAAHRSTIVETLENVEGMSVQALNAGIVWDFETFPEYLDAVAQRGTRLNVGAFIGHTPLRYYVLGLEATERAATADEVEQMRSLLRQAMAAGAAGFSTSRHTGHVGAGGRPVPSRLADLDEVYALAEVLGEGGHGLLQLTAGTALSFEELAALSAKIGRPVTNSALVTGTMAPGRTLELADYAATVDGQLWPQITCRPIVTQLSLEEPYMLARIPAFTEVLESSREDRIGIYLDRSWRRRAEADVTRWAEGRWDRATVEETVRHGAIKGRPLSEVAAERGVSPFDVFVDLSLEDDLATRFQFVRLNDDKKELGELLRKEHTVLGLSDAGAHGDSLCDACFSTALLSEWVRDRQALTLEEAVWRLTAQPAGLLELRDRGLVREGYVADLVAFDPDRIGTGGLERVWDLPGGANRLIARGTGVEHVWVGGTPVRRDGMDIAGVRPGVVLKG